MRKIVSKQEEDKRKKRNQFIVGGVLILLMIVSTLGYAFQGQVNNPATTTNTTTYNGVTFANQNGYWVTVYNNQKIIFTYPPSQISFDMTNVTKKINDFSNKPVYIFSEDSNSTSELSVNLAKFASQVIPVQNLLSKDCSNNFIIVQNNPSESIIQQQNCIIISGQGQDLIGMTDNVLFKLLGIKQ